MDDQTDGAAEMRAEPSVPLNTLYAAIDRIIPADDFPSASDAGVADYILRQLAGDAQSLAASITAGLVTLDREARQKHALAFAALTPAQQDRILACLQTGDVCVPWTTAPAAFLASLVELTTEGYYSDPGNGGNRNALSWTMIGYHPGVPGVERA